jgi:hypothetical protein
MIIYSKTYDFTNKILMNLKISQFTYSTKKIKFPFKNFALSLLVKKEMVKTKNKLIITVLSMLFLISGLYPFYKLKNYKRFIFCEYKFQSNANKLFFLLDIVLFIMYHYMKKSHEIIKKVKSGEKYEMHFFHMYNISMIRAFDPYLALFPDTNIIAKITNNASDTKDAKFIGAAFKI